MLQLCQSLLIVALLCLLGTAGSAASAVKLLSASKPGGAGHALLFRDHVATVEHFKGFPTDELTFEAWISTTDFCHGGTILSYFLGSSLAPPSEEESSIDHFVIVNPKNVLACHDFIVPNMVPDLYDFGCVSAFAKATAGPLANMTEVLNDLEILDKPLTRNLVERDGAWHHLAVTWVAKEEGRTRIYIDGSLMADVYTNKTEPLKAGGRFLLGQSQECSGGCSYADQAFFGTMDEVRVWNVVRSQKQIVQNMRMPLMLDEESKNHLLAYWKFNEPDEDGAAFRTHLVSKDWSNMGNDLLLTHPTDRGDITIQRTGKTLTTGRMRFHNNYAIGDVVGMPNRSFTVEFWAKGPAIDALDWTQNAFCTMLSYATATLPEGSSSPPATDAGSSVDDDTNAFDYVGDYSYDPSIAPHVTLMDDAIRVDRYMQEVQLDGQGSVLGMVVVSINSNMKAFGVLGSSGVWFNASWIDDQWHHIAVTWEYESGKTRLYLDGKAANLLWQAIQGLQQRQDTSIGSMEGHISAGIMRLGSGSLALGMDQNCPGGCLELTTTAKADMAVVRVWDHVLTQAELQASMFRDDPVSTQGLVSQFSFKTTDIVQQGPSMFIKDSGAGMNKLAIRGSSPLFVYSTAPLVDDNGFPVPQPQPGSAGYALSLSDKQVVLMPDFKLFPTTAITVEFWMFSTDACRAGVPFSYATGAFGQGDNSFLIFDYNSWGVSVMEDEGLFSNYDSSVSATDGKWHHIAVTWESSTGMTVLYQDARPVWSAVRAKGRSITPGGTLVIGREQDCVGGCFDSAQGAVGKISYSEDQLYGPQDFTGLMENMRIWKSVRTPEQIAASRRADQAAAPPPNAPARAGKDISPTAINIHHPDLVAFWKFDEGTGFEVRDETSNGNNLTILTNPQWEVVRWLATCGNGVVEAGEQCDDGDLDDGNGCSIDCQVEDGWKCRGNPSVCTRKGEKQPQQRSSGTGQAARSSSKRPQPKTQTRATPGHGNKQLGGAQIFFIVVGCISGICLLMAAAVYRHQVTMAATGAYLWLAHPRRNDYNGLDVDSEGLDLTPTYTVIPLPPSHSEGILLGPAPAYAHASHADQANHSSSLIPKNDGSPFT